MVSEKLCQKKIVKNSIISIETINADVSSNKVPLYFVLTKKKTDGEGGNVKISNVTTSTTPSTSQKGSSGLN